MKKNAFTLIELIATIGLLGLLATITITISVRKINETKESARDTMFESIELAAEKYVNDNEEDLSQFKNNDNIYISLQTLVEKEYFTESLVDPTTKKSLPLSNEIYVIREENGKIKAKYNINQRTEPKLTLKGSYNEYLETGKEYQEQGVTAIKDGIDVSNSVTITGTVDNKVPDTYKITYTLDNVKITRNVIVFSKNIESQEITIASKYIERLYKSNNYQNDELKQTTATYTDENSKEITVDAGLRYVGASPNNYVYFNCKDKDSKNIEYGKINYDYANSCEVWRIIGVFAVDNGSGKVEKRVKLINTASTFMASWDSSACTGSCDSDDISGWGMNQWGESTYADGSEYEGADLMNLLNGYYIGESNTCKYCNEKKQGTCDIICDSDDKTLESQKMKPLTLISKKIIKNAVWDTYAVRNNSSASIVYLEEKGITAQYTGVSECTGCNKDLKRTTNWIGLVGLMSFSDSLYANGWLECFAWTITPHVNAGVQNFTWFVKPTSPVTGAGGASSSTAFVYPSLYLSSSVKISGGNGSSNSPYKLSI